MCNETIIWIGLAYENPRVCQSACQTCSFATRLSFAGSSGRVISLLLTVINRLPTRTYKTPLSASEAEGYRFDSCRGRWGKSRAANALLQAALFYAPLFLGCVTSINGKRISRSCTIPVDMIPGKIPCLPMELDQARIVIIDDFRIPRGIERFQGVDFHSADICQTDFTALESTNAERWAPRSPIGF